MIKIQAILFSNKNWDSKLARKWLKDNKFKPIKKVHKTDNYLRYRISVPNAKRYFLKEIGHDLFARSLRACSLDPFGLVRSIPSGSTLTPRSRIAFATLGLLRSAFATKFGLKSHSDQKSISKNYEKKF